MEKALERDEGHTELLFSREVFAHLDWTRKEKEFRYQNKMYDVASVRIIGKVVYVSCVFDKEETGLRKTLKDFFTPSSGKNSPLRNMVRMLSQKYIAHLSNTLRGLDNFLFFKYKPYLFILHVYETEFDTPPPKV